MRYYHSPEIGFAAFDVLQWKTNHGILYNIYQPQNQIYEALLVSKRIITAECISEAGKQWKRWSTDEIKTAVWTAAALCIMPFHHVSICMSENSVIIRETWEMHHFLVSLSNLFE